MRRYFKLITFIVMARLLCTCVEPYNPDIPKYDNILVVDGMITDLEEPYYIDLTRSMPYEDIDPDRELGAEVVVTDDQGNTYDFTESGRGRYVSDPSEFRGIAGRNYQLHIITSDGNEYESEWMELRRVPEIDTLYWTFEEKETDNPENAIQGVQVYLSTEDPLNETWYYKWEWIETWEFTTPFIAAGRPALHQCWKTESSSDIEIATSKYFTVDAIGNHPLAFISQETNRLGIRYSMLVRQYSLSPEAFSFWKQLQDINQKMGSLFDPTPMAVLGNIYGVNDPDIPVLGYFQASAVSIKRIFVDRSDLPVDLVVSTGYEYCEIMILQDPTQIQIDDAIRNGWVFLDTYTFIGITYWRFTNAQSCYDCTAEGVNKKPSYWPESRK